MEQQYFLADYHLIFIEGASSLPLSINILQDYNVQQSTPEVQRQQVPVTPQSPLTKRVLTPIYGNADILKAHTLHADSDFFTASCPDIPSHTYYNSTNNKSKSPEVPNCIVHSASNSDSVAKNNLKSSEIPPQVESTSVTSSNTDVSSHTYHNITDWVGQKTTPNQSPKVDIHPTTTPVKTALTKEVSGDHSHLVEVIKKQLPDISRREITQSLIRNDGNTEQAVKDIKLNQLINMKLDGITEADCRTILEQCNWDLSTATEILCSYI